MRAMTPARSALTSRLIFSVSSSTIGSPISTRSPSFFIQRAMRASSTDSPSCGTTMVIMRVSDLLGKNHGRCRRRTGHPEVECLLDERRLVQLVPGGRPLRRARVAGAPDVAKRPAIADELLEPRPHEFPRAHVFRLLLEPDDLASRRVPVEDLGQGDAWKRVELFDAADRDPGRGLPRLAGEQVHGHLAA